MCRASGVRAATGREPQAHHALAPSVEPNRAALVNVDRTLAAIEDRSTLRLGVARDQAQKRNRRCGGPQRQFKERLKRAALVRHPALKFGDFVLQSQFPAFQFCNLQIAAARSIKFILDHALESLMFC